MGSSFKIAIADDGRAVQILVLIARPGQRPYRQADALDWYHAPAGVLAEDRADDDG